MIGRFVFSKAGHDKNNPYIVIATEGEFVYLCDGRQKTLSKPKKKRMKHIQPTNLKVNDSLLEKLIQLNTAEKVQLCDVDIKYELKCLLHV